MMDRRKTRLWVVLALVLILFNIVAFCLPVPKNGTFWVSYIFTMIAILAQVYVFKVAFKEGETLQSKVYGFPVARIGFLYGILQVIVGLVFIGVCKWVPFWIPLIIFAILLVAAAIGFVAADMTRDEIIRQEVSHKAEISAMRMLKARVTALGEQYPQNEALSAFAEKMQYSDPVSSEALAEVEQRLAGVIDTMANNLTVGQDVTQLCRQADMILTERNHLCKASK